VIQRLFAVGVGLQSVIGSSLGADVYARLTAHINVLDETTDEIRAQVFGLRDGAAASRAASTSLGGSSALHSE
jgi:hypothetical protein